MQELSKIIKNYQKLHKNYQKLSKISKNYQKLSRIHQELSKTSNFSKSNGLNI